jgi:hypothetical protein
MDEILKSKLFEIVGACAEVDPVELKGKIINSFEEVSQRGQNLSNAVKIEFDQASHFSQKVNILIQNGCLTAGEHEKFIYRVFWHNIVYIEDSIIISPQSIYFDKNKFLNELTQRIYSNSF